MIKKLFTPLLALALTLSALIPLTPFSAGTASADTYYVDQAADPATPPGGDTGGGGSESAVDPAVDGKYYVSVDLYHASLNQTSMGNVAFEHQALVVTSGGHSVIQVGTHPVEVSGYTTAITEVEDARTVQSEPFTTNTKFDGAAHDITYLRVFELDLPNVTSTYLTTRIKVPYTPMDAVGAATDGWLNARFKIDWSSVTKAPAGTELNPSTAVTSGTSSISTITAPAASLADSATGIKLTAPAGVVPADAQLKISAIASGTNYEKAKKALAEISGKFKLFDISLIQDSAEIQPNGTITLTIPLPAGYDPAKTVFYRINDDGTATLIKGSATGNAYEVLLNRLSLYALAEGAEAVAIVPAATAATVDIDKFTDISGHWAYASIQFAVERGLFAGVSATEFAPQADMTRGMFVTVLARIAAADLSAYTASAFTDVADDTWYTGPVAWAAANRIVSGVGDNVFAPSLAITRQEMAVILANYIAFADISLNEGAAVTFADAGDIASWAQAAVNQFAAAGLIAGVGDNLYAPLKTATRAEVATLLTQFVQGYID